MTIDIEPYLQDISPDAPCGEDLSYDSEMLELETTFQGRPAQQIGDASTEAVEPNWNEVKDRAESLLKRTHDLRVILQYAVALTETEGLPGLKAGLTLLEQTIARHWEHLYPQLDPDDNNDPLERVNIMAGMNIPANTMGDPLQFRMHVQRAPLTNSRGFGRVTYRDILAARSGAPAGEGDDGEHHLSSSEIDAAFKDSDLEYLVENHEAIAGAVTAVKDLDAKLTDQVGAASATSFDGVLEDLRAIESEMGQQLRNRGYGVAGEEGAPEADGGAPGAVAAAPGAALSGEVNSPRDAENALDKVIRYYENHEPSSPVPMLVKVAKALISKSFIDISSSMPPDTVETIMRIISPDRDDE